MARDIINVYLPQLEDSQSVASAKIEPQNVTVANGIEIADVAKNKNNSLVIVIENTADSSETVSFIAGDTYPNSMLGDLVINIDANATTVCQIQDFSRFENRDGSLYIDFSATFTGNIYAVAKRAGLVPVV